LCITFAGEKPIRAHAHANTHIFTFVIAEALIKLDLYCVVEGSYVAHPVTGFYYYCSYLNSSSFRHVVQHRLVIMAAGVLGVLKGFQPSGRL
jgi:hypothetical protein